MELVPNNPDNIKCRPSIHHVSSQVTAGNEYYSLKELAYGHLVIRMSSEKNADLVSAIQTVTGLTLPTKPLSSTNNGSFIMNGMSPDEYLLLVPNKTEFEVESKLRQLITCHYAIVNITGGQTVLELSGKRSETILKKSTSYNIHSSAFPIGKVVTSVFAKSQAVIRRTDKQCFQLIVRRSFSDYLWKWIVDAGSRD